MGWLYYQPARDGRSFIQHVEHLAGPGEVPTNYPVTADPRIQNNWWGQSFQFSKWETQVIAWGGGAVAVYFGWTGVLAVVAYAMPAAATWAVKNNYCLAVNRSWNGYIWPWYFRC